MGQSRNKLISAALWKKISSKRNDNPCLRYQRRSS